MQFHYKKNHQELKYVFKRSKRYVFLPAIPIEPSLSRNEETVTTMNRYFCSLMAYKKLRPNIQLFFSFCQKDLGVLLTKQSYKTNCEIIKIKINREKGFNKTMTKHIKNLNNIFCILRQ